MLKYALKIPNMQSAYKICTNPRNMQKYALISRHFGNVYSLLKLVYILPDRNIVPEKICICI